MAKTLTVYLAADLKKFNSGMRDAQGSVQGFGGTLKGMLGPALIAAGAAAGAFAIKLGVDGVKAAMEDQKAVEALSTTLDNLNLAHSTESIEAYIYELERAYGVADTELRPAYDRLIRSTKDVEKANKALKTAMDISASTGKSLETVSDALGRAYDGNTVSLGRLGLGIDRTALATMSLDDIMVTLADTFGGQADAQARTFEGQLGRLTTATDNLKEAFGAGLLNALGDTDELTQDLVDTMEDMEPVLQGLGEALGLFATEALKTYTDAMEDANVATDQVAQQMGGLQLVAQTTGALVGEIFGSLTGPNSPLGVVLRGIGLLADDLNTLSGSGSSAGEAFDGLSNSVERATVTVSDNRIQAINAGRELNEWIETIEDGDDTVRNFGGSVEKLTAKQKRLIESYELQGIIFQTTKKDLLDQIATLQEATKAVEDYANTIQQDLLSGINLGELYQNQFDEDGNRTGVSWVDGFNKAIEQAEWFGNVLTALKSRGIDQSLLEQISSLGPETGGALGQELLDGPGALLDTINDKWVGVQDKTRELALGLVPEFLLAGEKSASDYLQALAGKFGEDQRSFKKLGNLLGRQVGQEFKARTLKEIADAVKQVEALATSARAEAVARAERQQARITEQAVAEAINNLIRNSDQRAGRNVQPVLQ